MLVLNPVLEYGADPYVSIVDDSWCLIQADSIKGRIYLKISNSSLLDVFSQKQELVFDISSIDISLKGFDNHHNQLFHAISGTFYDISIDIKLLLPTNNTNIDIDIKKIKQEKQ